MAKTLNRVQLIGRLGADPEMRNTQAGMTVATFGLATSRQWPGKDGTMQEETEWHNIVVWDKLAQLCCDFLTKGRLVYIEGRIHTRSYDRDGQKQYRTEIVASDMLLLDPKPGTGDGDERDSRNSGATPAPVGAVRNESRRVPAGAVHTSRREVEVDPDELPF
ncbi:MAG: single-stranded DNA-binding protein [Chloroflexota bacterium]